MHPSNMKQQLSDEPNTRIPLTCVYADAPRLAEILHKALNSTRAAAGPQPLGWKLGCSGPPDVARRASIEARQHPHGLDMMIGSYLPTLLFS